MKTEPLIIVDGYNLMHQIVPVRSLQAPKGLERARASVVDRISRSVPPDQHPVTCIVFDAASGKVPDPDSPIGAVQSPVRVLFATGHPDADTMIEEMIRRHSSPHRLTVVSSDRRLLTAAARRGARGMDCQSWLDRQERLSGSLPVIAPQTNEQLTPPVPDPVPPMSPEEREQWLRAFGVDSPEAGS